MSQARYALYEGVPGCLVALPGTQELAPNRRFAGMRRKPGAKMTDKGGLADLFEPTLEVIVCEGLSKPVANGELKLIAGPVTASNPNEARAMLRALQAKAAPKPAGKSDEKSGGGSK